MDHMQFAPMTQKPEGGIAPLRFAVVNLGCKVNRTESDGYESLLLAKGAEDVSSVEDPLICESADLVIVNTCTVTMDADKKTRKAIRQALRRYPRAVVFVTGCAAAIEPAFFAAMDERVRVVPKAAMADELSAFALQAPLAAPCGTASGLRSRRGVKVQDGCNHACTYCIVHVARGPSTSRPLPDVEAEVRALVADGIGEIVLTGINLGSYQDRSGEGARGLAGLLDVLLADTAGVPSPETVDTALGNDAPPWPRFRLSSIEPLDVDDDLIALLATSEGRVCRHLHLPLQSGSTDVLRAMARPYDADYFRDLVNRLREAVSSIALSTDIIVGFPGETEAQFQETLALARECGFSRIHVFPYSPRPGTPAAARTDQVPPEVKMQRAAALRALGDSLRAEDRARRAGSSEWVYVQENGIVMTESYYEFPAPAETAANSLVRFVFPDPV